MHAAALAEASAILSKGGCVTDAGAAAAVASKKGGGTDYQALQVAAQVLGGSLANRRGF